MLVRLPALLRAFVVLAIPSLASAQIFGREPVDPFDVRSPSGSHVLHVDPTSSDGKGLAKYRLSRGKEVLWTKTLPCTLRDVQLGDDGVFAGTAELEAYGGGEEFRLMIVAPDGATRFDQKVPRDEAAIIDGPTYPLAAPTVLVPELDRAIFRIQHLVDNHAYEEWRSVRLSNGEVIGSSNPADHMPDGASLRRLTRVAPILGTPLLVCHAARLKFRSDTAPGSEGAYFALVGADSQPVWELDLPNDYDNAAHGERASRVWMWAARSGALLDCAEPRRFAIALAAEAKRVTYEVSADPASKVGWSVREVGRVDFKLPIDEGRKPRPEKEYPPLALEFVGAIELQGAATNAEKIGAFDIDDRGRLGAIVLAPNAKPRFVLRGANGELTADEELELGTISGLSMPTATWLRGDRWLIHARTWTEDDHALAWWLDLPAGTLTPLDGFECAPIDKADGTFDGGFVALTSQSAEYTIVTTLSSFDEHGKLRWQDTEAYGNSESGLFSPEDVAFSPKGELGVIDNIKNVIQRFDLGGKLVGEIDLEKVLGREPNYPTEIGVDPDGNWVVCDFQGSPSVLRVSREEKLTASFTPMYAEGRTFRSPDGVRVAPDGKLWTTDGYALVRLNALGVVDQVVGDAPTETNLGDVECVFVDHTGRILVSDERTHSIHVFDSQGKPKALCGLDPKDVDEQTEIDCIAVAPDLSVHVGPLADEVRAYRGFGADGASLGDDPFDGTTRFQPKSGMRWDIHRGAIQLYDPRGKELRKLLRSADDRWLASTDGSAVAVDGTLVVGARGRYHLFAPDGTPRASFERPDGARYGGIALSSKSVITSSGDEVWCTDLESKMTTHAQLGAEFTPNSSSHAFWRADASELWIFDTTAKKVLRYRVKS